MPQDIQPKAEFFIEVLHEVANPIGGVYTVVVTKSAEMKKYYGGNFWAIGAYYPKYAKVEFEEQTPHQDMKTLFDGLAKDKIICHYGTWLIPGKPKAVLIDYSKRMNTLTSLKRRLKKDYDVDAKNCGPNLDRQIVWSDCVSRLFEKFLGLREFDKKKGVVHFHLSDPGLFLLDLAKKNPPVGIIYTAHSTRLGRYIAIKGCDLIDEIRKNKNKTVRKGREYQFGGMVKTVHQFERACARVVDVFTSVSELTSVEAKYILGRKTDVVTPNGLDVSSFPSLEERAELHIHAKNKIYNFLNAYFSPYYPIDLKNDLLLFTSGRYELRTKGYDIFFKALAKLNQFLKQRNYPNNIFVFLFIMLDSKKPDHEILENLAVYHAIEHEVDKEFPHIKNRVMNLLLHGQDLKKEAVFDDNFLTNTKKLMLKFKQQQHETPPISAFKGLKKNDPLLTSLMEKGLTNKREDIVKVIFYPAPVSVADGLLSMDYFYVVAGMHLGVFPSIYEPWGYTPLETAAHSVMSITTDASGFGKFISHHTRKRKRSGISVLRAEGVPQNQIVNELTKLLSYFCTLSKGERIERKLDAHNLAQLADWKVLAKEYVKAHNLAVEKCAARQKSKNEIKQ